MSVEDVSQENLVRRIFLRYFLYVQIHRQISIEAKNLRYVGLISQRRGMIPGCHTLWLTNDAIVFFLRMTRRQARVYGTRDDIYDSQGIRQQFRETQESRRWSRRQTFNSFAYCASTLIDDVSFCSLVVRRYISLSLIITSQWTTILFIPDHQCVITLVLQEEHVSTAVSSNSVIGNNVTIVVFKTTSYSKTRVLVHQDISQNIIKSPD